MKAINQIIIEGILNTNPEFEELGNDKISYAFLENDEVACKVKALGNMAEILMLAKSGSKIRVIGKLSSEYNLGWCILAEHIEIKSN